MLKVVFYWILLFVPASFAQSQTASLEESDFISWNEFYKLQWHDFQGEPDEHSIGDAGTAVKIKAKPYLIKNEVRYDVYALFNRNKSWARDQSAALLAHEQLHFDIAELYARKIRKKINKLNDNGVNDVKTFNAAIQELLYESNEVDERYDLETLHGALSKKQAAWAEKIKEELISLQHYKKPKRIINGS
jgi:predicted secreted Zn-dependent protease